MDLTEVKKKLEENFNRELQEGKERHIVFWYDARGEFTEDIDELELDNAKILKLTNNNAFYIKYLLEQEDLSSNYLIYSPMAKPVARENWLIDIQKYSIEFSTDKATLIMHELGVDDPSLLNIFSKHLKFFDNKERSKKFSNYNIQNYTEEKVEIAVMSALCKLPGVDFEQVVKKVLMGEVEETNKYLEDIEKFGDLEAFWSLVQKYYGYNFEERSLEKLIIMLLVSHLNYYLDELPETWQKFISPRRSDCIVFVDNFMSHSSDRKAYNQLADRVEEILNVKAYVEKWDIDTIIKCDTFRAFDERFINKLKQNLLDDVGEFEKYRKTINNRRTSHWFNEYKAQYESLYYALEMLEMEKRLGGFIKGQSAYELMDSYTKELYLMDQFYRKFYMYYDQVENKDLFADLAERIENLYAHWYLDKLSVKWSRAVEEELLEDFHIAGIKQQKDFYNSVINPYMKSDDRVFVIISDALRYEVGKELLDALNKEIRGDLDINFMQGVVPSTTKLGMASLLPRKNIEIDDEGKVIVDEINTQGIDNREKILASHKKEAVAIQYDELDGKGREYYKEKFSGKKLIYIYHNTIDAYGDSSQTEKEVFEAAEKTIKELQNLVKNLVNHVSAINVYITSDHGFIYRRSALKESDKITKNKTSNIEEGRRYLLTKAEEASEDSLPVSMKYMLGKNTGLKAVVPKGVIRYKVQGAGANFVHGGASLQEITIPLIKYKNIRKDDYKASKVEVQLTSISRKITNRITYLEFFQKEKVGDKKLPLQLRAYFADEEGNRISNEVIIIADSRSEKPKERMYKEKFTLKNMAYDKEKNYYLVLEDEEESVEKVYDKISFTIDMIITDDFDF